MDFEDGGAKGSNSLVDQYSAILMCKDMITIVGPTGQEYMMHKALLMQKSKYFQKALSLPMSENASGVLSLSDIQNEAALVMTLAWMYSGDLRSSPNKGSLNKGTKSLAWIDLAEAWILADYLLMPAFQNHIMDIMVKKLKETNVDIRISSRIWTETHDQSPLQRFFLDILGHKTYSQRLDGQEMEGIPAVHIAAAIKSLAGQGQVAHQNVIRLQVICDESYNIAYNEKTASVIPLIQETIAALQEQTLIANSYYTQEV